MFLVQITQHNFFFSTLKHFFLNSFIVKQFCNLQTDISMPAKTKKSFLPRFYISFLTQISEPKSLHNSRSKIHGKLKLASYQILGSKTNKMDKNGRKRIKQRMSLTLSRLLTKHVKKVLFLRKDICSYTLRQTIFI